MISLASCCYYLFSLLLSFYSFFFYLKLKDNFIDSLPLAEFEPLAPLPAPNAVSLLLSKYKSIIVAKTIIIFFLKIYLLVSSKFYFFDLVCVELMK